ncbi:TPA: AIPR family protein [Clostridium perfringens]|uniref:AIPR family protein n=1 Tax=Clostridium perfringens TaxID=1502 RepID=UPI0029079DB9|nr:AIPR family protein [Clostridium perfringens]EJT5928369.1 AIPR family protein [Clostridium perfringens]EJT6483090.1 AIPR family protein [Clostridium perfringens]MDU6209360.1 AIPR family protein [Clostridium perfringens]BDA23373.1 hypothetical protein CPBEC1_25830 [Clostridium perfringens]
MPGKGVDTPTSISIVVEDYTEKSIKGSIEYTLYINGQEYKRLPLDANVREPEPLKSSPYKDMCKTLREEPEKFFENNLGISVIAPKVEKISKNKLRLVFPSGTGILNGGHTQQAILDIQKEKDISKALVRVRVTEKSYTLKRIAEIAATQNSSSGVKKYSLAEKRGYFAKLKKYIEDYNEKHIIWYEGRKVVNKGLEASDLIAMINLFNIKAYMSEYSEKNEQPTLSATSKTKAFEKWEDDPYDYECIYPLINDIIDLYEYIILNYANSTGITKLEIIKDKRNKAKKPLIFSGAINDYDMPKQFLLPVLAAFRSNIYYDEYNKKVGWYGDNRILFDKLKKEIARRLMSTYKSTYHNEINRASKDANLWEILYSTVNSQVPRTSGRLWKEYDI